ncbi:MAG: hypothetical protein A3C06_00265 [Candidatus Taylorbacteria bacterium RIFCSPHIGHO2_02_FULL_46_13]|uniref:Uncharacterized protein n=1 Tax=Candidatus Taylorbacteria bacterium RIFCSPHIGHO2_02_FULL_46_13 TaxID=1802312 RepID=A0A1G2MUU9_9BACT|nr:MAG: hypothetical protein A3C06_00265 [Candidatus Taylorbacteria bacterium RIFCSPHIGHO2_02_FULL_46_13]
MNAAKEKFEIVSGAAPPPFRIFAGGLPRRRRLRNAFGLIQEYCKSEWKKQRKLLVLGIKARLGISFGRIQLGAAPVRRDSSGNTVYFAKSLSCPYNTLVFGT